MRLSIALATMLMLGTASVPALAQNDLYDNGPTNGTIDAWNINESIVTSDSFNLTSSSTVNGLNFAAWLEPGDVLESAEISLTSLELGGTTFFDQTVNFTQSGCVLNQLGFNVCNETGSFPGVAMNAGTYWLNIGNAVVNNGDPAYWDENDGPSSASHNEEGTLPSESFTILGSSSSGTGTTPEPGSLLLFASGVAALWGVVRRKLL